MKELFIKIQTNAKNYSKDELEKIEKFINDEIIVKTEEGNFEINSKYKVALVRIEKRVVILEDLVSELKNIKIEFDELNGAYNGDLVLAKRVFNPRSKTKAKIVKILDNKKNDILVYVKDNSYYTLKENIRLEHKSAYKYDELDVLVIDNKSFDLVDKIGNLNDAKIDEYISLNLYSELYRLEKHLEVEALMDDTRQRIDLRELPFCTIDPNSAKDHENNNNYDSTVDTMYVAIDDVPYFLAE